MMCTEPAEHRHWPRSGSCDREPGAQQRVGQAVLAQETAPDEVCGTLVSWEEQVKEGQFVPWGQVEMLYQGTARRVLAAGV